MVAAWISAEIGVGPGIASGSQVWNGNCADLPTTATTSRTAGSHSSSRGSAPSVIAAMHRADPVGPEPLAEHQDREQQPQVGGPGDQERLHGPGARVGELPVVRDQEVGAGAHQLPADEQHPQVVGGHDGDHRAGEQRHQRGVRRVARVAGEVPQGVHLHQERDRRGEQQHRGADSGSTYDASSTGGPDGAAGGEHVRERLGVAEVRERQHPGEHQARAPSRRPRAPWSRDGRSGARRTA